MRQLLDQVRRTDRVDSLSRELAISRTRVVRSFPVDYHSVSANAKNPVRHRAHQPTHLSLTSPQRFRDSDPLQCAPAMIGNALEGPQSLFVIKVRRIALDRENSNNTVALPNRHVHQRFRSASRVAKRSRTGQAAFFDFAIQ